MNPLFQKVRCSTELKQWISQSWQELGDVRLLVFCDLPLLGQGCTSRQVRDKRRGEM